MRVIGVNRPSVFFPPGRDPEHWPVLKQTGLRGHDEM